MKRLLFHQRGAAALEFGLALPPFLILILGAIQLGVIAMARTGLQHAVDEGARYASIFPTPSDPEIVSRVTAREFGLDAHYTNQPTIVHGTQYGIPYTEITMTYSRPLNFVFFQTPPIAVSYTRRSY